MITLHHLNESRSQRILWLLEELQVPYRVQLYQRNPQTRLAPPELKAVHPLGKSPVITDGERVVAESGAIVDYLIRHHGKGRLRPDPASPDFEDYSYWIHYSEGSGMFPLLLKGQVAKLGPSGEPLQPRIASEIANHLGYLEASLKGRDYLVGAAFSGADVQMSFVGELAAVRTDCTPYPNMLAWVRRLQARPAYQTALKHGGPYPYVLKNA